MYEIYDQVGESTHMNRVPWVRFLRLFYVIIEEIFQEVFKPHSFKEKTVTYDKTVLIYFQS